MGKINRNVFPMFSPKPFVFPSKLIMSYPSIHIMIRKDRPNTDGSFPIRLRLTHNRIHRYISTPWNVAPRQINSRGEITNYRISEFVQKLVRDYRAQIEILGVRAQEMDIDEVLTFIVSQNEREKPFRLDFVEYTRAYAQYLIDKGSAGTAGNYTTAINSLVRFAKREVIYTQDMTVKYLQRWLNWVTEEASKSNRINAGNRAAECYHSALRAMFNRAMKEFNDYDQGVIHLPQSPFTYLSLPRSKPARKRSLSPAEIRAIAQSKPTESKYFKRWDFARDMFMLSFYLVGMNAADLYDVEASAYKDGRLTYKRCKTRTRRADEAEISIKVEPEAEAIIKKYRATIGSKLLDLRVQYAANCNLNAALAKGLKQIGTALGIDNLQFYSARHSWATIAVNDLQIDKYTVHEALNHVDPMMRVTDMYIKKDYKNIDRANRAVIDFINEVPSQT